MAQNKIREIVASFLIKNNFPARAAFLKSCTLGKLISFLPQFVINTIMHCRLLFAGNLMTYKEHIHQIIGLGDHLKLPNMPYRYF